MSEMTSQYKPFPAFAILKMAKTGEGVSVAFIFLLYYAVTLNIHRFYFLHVRPTPDLFLTYNINISPMYRLHAEQIATI